MIEFLKSKPFLKPYSIAKEIGWNAGNMNQWINGKRPIPKDKEKKLKKILTQYGYNED